MSPSPPERDTQIDLICADLPFNAEQLSHIQIGGSLCGSAKTEITVRDGLHSRLRPQLAEFAATECPPGAHGEGPAGPATLDPVGGMSARLSARLRVSFPERHAIHLNPDHPSIQH
jgi:hypothetical protein